MSDTVITRQLTRVFDGREVVKDVNLRVEQGIIYGPDRPKRRGKNHAVQAASRHAATIRRAGAGAGFRQREGKRGDSQAHR